MAKAVVYIGTGAQLGEGAKSAEAPGGTYQEVEK
jgi:hypothetical protein